MKHMMKILVFFSVALLLMNMLPAMQLPASAAATPILSISAYYADAAENPFLEYYLDPDIYGEGGPYTVSFEWKSDGIFPFDVNDPQTGIGFACVVGYMVGSNEPQPQSNVTMTGGNYWRTVSFSFENVGNYNDISGICPGNLLRFGLYKGRGTLFVKNLKISDADGAVVYNLNADQTVQGVLSDLQEQLVAECDFSEISDAGWRAGQFGSGTYTATLTYLCNPRINTTVAVPKWDDPFILSGEQKIKPASRLMGSHGYADNEIFMYGDGWGFGDKPWEKATLPEIVLDGPIEILKSDTERVTEVRVMSPSFEGRQEMAVSDLPTLSPGYYAIVFGTSSCSSPKNGVQYIDGYECAFALIVSSSDGTTSKPTTTASTTRAPTTKPLPCSTGHDFMNGYCITCLEKDPNFNHSQSTSTNHGVDCPGKPTLPPESTTTAPTESTVTTTVDSTIHSSNTVNDYSWALYAIIGILSVSIVSMLVVYFRKK